MVGLKLKDKTKRSVWVEVNTNRVNNNMTKNDFECFLSLPICANKVFLGTLNLRIFETQSHVTVKVKLQIRDSRE